MKAVVYLLVDGVLYYITGIKRENELAKSNKITSIHGVTVPTLGCLLPSDFKGNIPMNYLEGITSIFRKDDEVRQKKQKAENRLVLKS